MLLGAEGPGGGGILGRLGGLWYEFPVGCVGGGGGGGGGGAL